MTRVESTPHLSAAHVVRWIGGRPGLDLDQREHFVVAPDGCPRWTAAILFENASTPFRQHFVWNNAGVVAFGGGTDAWLLRIQDGSVARHMRLDSYFGSFAMSSEGSAFFVATGTSLVALNPALETSWIAEDIAVDGVLVAEVGAQRIRVNVELDPPDGWRELLLERESGRVAK